MRAGTVCASQHPFLLTITKLPVSLDVDAVQNENCDGTFKQKCAVGEESCGEPGSLRALKDINTYVL